MSGNHHPLQTRACWLTPDRLENTQILQETLEDFAERSYNTIIFPVLYDGEVSFQCDQIGDLRPKRCAGLRALELLADSEFTVWLSIDPLSAGAPGARDLGTLARRNRQWLMKNVEGNFKVKVGNDLPGLFCWTSLNFRRFVGNLITALVESHPVDGVVFDMRFIPRTTQDPSTWTHLGYSCLRWIQDGLDVDLERFLTRPSMEKHEEINQLRLEKLMDFLENLIARSRLQGGELSTHLLADLRNSEDPYAPWIPLYKEGLVSEVMLLAKAEDIPAHQRALDHLLPSPRPYLAAIKTETDLGDLAKSMEETSALGFCVLKPGPLGRATMPRAPYEWNFPGAVEQEPLHAICTMLQALKDQFSNDGDISAILEGAPVGFNIPSEPAPSYQDVMEFRDALLDHVRLLRSRVIAEDGNNADGNDVANLTTGILRLEAFARLLILSPVQACVVQ
ncbi:MAG: hypothetical protein JJU11_15015 [Candidatus Sumerlaeia bacterium]|nr:hypothetical protein [Candidatus Sumerlaeia bacterium]